MRLGPRRVPCPLAARGTEHGKTAAEAAKKCAEAAEALKPPAGDKVVVLGE